MCQSGSQALQQLADIEQRKKKPPPKKDTETEEAHAKRTEPRASSTDPEARVMKMADGDFRPAYNVQFVTTTDSQVIVGVEVCNSGSDLGQLAPMALTQGVKAFEPGLLARAHRGFLYIDEVNLLEDHLRFHRGILLPHSR